MMKKLLNTEQFCFSKNALKSKLKIAGEFGHNLGIIGKPLVSRI
jgi:hypothetical protein